MRVIIIAGGRDFDSYARLDTECRALLTAWNPPSAYKVLCGGARGADALGRRWAKEQGIEVQEFPAPWDTHGKAAGFLRNERMAEHADMLIAFWDGESKGTKHMIDLALKHGLEVHVYRYDPIPDERF